jgi:hypothetical protein
VSSLALDTVLISFATVLAREFLKFGVNEKEAALQLLREAGGNENGFINREIIHVRASTHSKILEPMRREVLVVAVL